MPLPDHDHFTRLITDQSHEHQTIRRFPLSALEQLDYALSQGIHATNGLPLSFSDHHIEVATGPGMMLRVYDGGIEDIAPQTDLEFYSLTLSSVRMAFGVHSQETDVGRLYPLRFYRTTTPINIWADNTPLSEVASPSRIAGQDYAWNIRALAAGLMISSPDLIDHAASNGLWYQLTTAGGIRESLALPAHHILRHVRNADTKRAFERSFLKIPGNSLVVIDPSATHHAALRQGITTALESIHPALVSVIQTEVLRSK